MGILCFRTKALVYYEARKERDKQLLSTCKDFGERIKIHPKTSEKITQPAQSLWESLLSDMGCFDPVLELSKTSQGRSFLALAATLVTMMSSSKTAWTLGQLLQSNESDLMVPSAGFLKPIVETIGSRYSKLGFTDEIIQWHWEEPDNSWGTFPLNYGGETELDEVFNRLDGKNLANVRIPTEPGYRVSLTITHRSEVDGEGDVWAVDTP